MRRLNSTALSTLRFFDVAARLLSFTRAAEELCVTQSAVSQHIKALEDRLQCKLFFRLPRQIKLTDDGKDFAEVITRKLRELDDAAEILVVPHRSKIDVRLRADPSFALGWLIPRLGRLHARCPKIKLHVIGNHGRFDGAEKSSDLAIEMAQAPPQRMHSDLLMQEYLIPICSPEYLEKHSYLITPADLPRCVLLHAAPPWQSASEDAEWRYWLNAVGAPQIESNRGQFFTFAHMAIEAALSHQGIAMGRWSLVEKLLDNRAVVTPFPQRIKTPTSYRLVYSNEITSRPGISEVVNWLHQEAESADQPRPGPVSRSNTTIGWRRQSSNARGAVDQPQSARSGRDIRPPLYRIG